MIRPFLFAACDKNYRALYKEAFLNSARAHGHEASVFCDGGSAGALLRPFYASLRFRMLPALLKTHQAVLLLDVDSIIREPIEVGESYDIGIFPRLDEAEEYKRVLAGIVYCTDRAAPFAQAIVDGIGGHDMRWGDDQRALWRAYDTMKDRYRVKKFTTRDMDWDTPTRARIFTAKGLQKIDQPFMAEVKHWKQRAA